MSELLFEGLPETLFPDALTQLAGRVLEAARRQELRLASAETVSSGLVGACLTSVSGASKLYERGFILYHSCAKASGLSVPEDLSATHGAVSDEVTRALAEGAIAHSGADAAVAVTGYAGPGGGDDHDPVGTIYVAAARRGGPVLSRRHVFAGSRDAVRLQAVYAALDILNERLET